MHRGCGPRAHRLRYRHVLAAARPRRTAGARAAAALVLARPLQPVQPPRARPRRRAERDAAARAGRARSCARRASPTPAADPAARMPRILGYAFNPLSVYFCHAPTARCGDPLRGPQHLRRAPQLPDPGRAAQARQRPSRQRCAKALHVSPFLRHGHATTTSARPPSPGATRSASASSPATRAAPARRRALRRRAGAARRRRAGARLLRPSAADAEGDRGIHWEALRLLAERRPRAAEAAATGRTVHRRRQVGPIR